MLLSQSCAADNIDAAKRTKTKTDTNRTSEFLNNRKILIEH